jgi:hypothetical protein
MADAKAIEDCKREITLLQVFENFLFLNSFSMFFFIFKAIKSSKCN